MKKFLPLLLLSVIVLVGSLMRIVKLEANPPSPYWEEVALGYDAFSIAKTGKDFNGNPYPLLAFPSYGDYKPSGYFYVLVPFVKLLGLNTFSVRLPSAFAGIISIILLYLIGKELFDRRVGLIAAALMAISPWAIQFSRGGWEVNLALMLVLAGAHCLLTARSKPWMLPIAVIFFGLSMYTYHAARLFAPLVGGLGGLILLVLWWKQTRAKSRKGLILPLMISVVLGLMCVLPFAVNLKSQTVSSRFSQTTVLSDLEPVLKSNAQIAEHGGGLIARVVYHRYWYYGQSIFQGFIKHFTPEFLFVRGDGNLRHWNGRYGLLYLMDFIFIIFAVVMLVLGSKRANLRGARPAIFVLLVWIMLAALPPALVKPTPHALRFLFAAPAFILLTAVGMSNLVGVIPRNSQRILIAAVIFAYTYLGGSYFYWYMNIYPARAASDWQYGYSQVFRALAREKKEHELVYMTRDQGRPSMFYLFFSAYDPAKIQAANPSLPKDQLELLQVDDYHFVDTLPGELGLYATPENKVAPGARILDTIRRPDGSVVWVIWRRT